MVSASTNYPLVAAHAALLANGNLALLMINKSATTDFTAQIALNNFSPGSASASLFSYGKPNDLANADLSTSTLNNVTNNFSATFPAYSMTVIILPRPQTFAAWQGQYFTQAELGDPTISGPTADPDHDGIPNLMEYALGLDPKTSSPAGLPVLGQQTVGAKNYLTLTFSKPRTISDVQYTVQVSADLVTWNSGPSYAIRVDDGSTDTAVFRDLTAIGDVPRHIVRLLVNQ
jgi:alpha-N-arabinofuranosidase